MSDKPLQNRSINARLRLIVGVTAVLPGCWCVYRTPPVNAGEEWHSKTCRWIRKEMRELGLLDDPEYWTLVNEEKKESKL